MPSSGNFVKQNCNARLGFASLANYFFPSFLHALAKGTLRRIKYLLINIFKTQVKLLLVVIAASSHSSHFTGNVTRTRKGQV